LEIDADFAEPPFGQLGGVQLIHSDTAVRRWTLTDATQNRPRPHFRHHLLIVDYPESNIQPRCFVDVAFLNSPAHSPEWRETRARANHAQFIMVVENAWG
jgi:hypothetical protein